MGRARLALACAGAAALAGAALAQDAGESHVRKAEDAVIVTGTRLHSAAAESAQDVRTYDRARIERSGRTTVADFLATVPEVSLVSSETTFIATSVRLRGAREGSTLILINGRRTQPLTGNAGPFGFFDLNTIPLSMVERIDILPSSSSAIYGGEALAGVVNIVMRTDFQGAEVSLGYKSADKTDEKNVYAGAGWKGERAKLSMMGTYSERSSLFGKDRDITDSPDYRRFGGPNLGSPFFGAPMNITSVSGNLPGLTSSFAAVPAGSTGVGLRPSDFAATAGTQTTGSFTHYQKSVSDSRRAGFYLSAEYRLGSGIDLFTELLASKYDNLGQQSPPALLSMTVPATNAFNPFGTAVRASGVVIGAEHLTIVPVHEEFVRPLVGARGTIGTWDWEATALYSRDKGGQTLNGQPNAAALAAALASSDPATALNPFRDGPMGSPELLASIFRNTVATTWKADATLLNGFVRGAVMSLPAGALDAVAGAEYERSGLNRAVNADRSARSAFGELRAPLLAGSDARGARREMLAVQGAIRYDNYSDFGAKTTWQAGIELRPVEPVLLRGTHGTAFKPPTIFNLGSPITSSALPVTDPLRNRETVVVQSISGGNPNLQPTTGTSSTLGIVWSPAQVRGLNMSVTGWRLQIDNAINLPDAQFIIDNEGLYPGRVTRGPSSSSGQPGSIVSANRTYINFGTLRESGIDAAADWVVKTSIGEFSPAAAATYMTKFKGASAPGGADVDRLSRANADGIFAPRVKANASIGWSPNPAFRLSLAGRYIGRYYDYTPTRTLGDFWYFDAAAEIAIGRMIATQSPAIRGIKLLVTGTNLADKLPPYSTHFRGYDVYNYDLIGRTIFVRLQMQI